jgi:hypothetical protein
MVSLINRLPFDCDSVVTCTNQMVVAISKGEMSLPEQVFQVKWGGCYQPFHLIAMDYFTTPLDAEETTRVQQATLVRCIEEYVSTICTESIATSILTSLKWPYQDYNRDHGYMVRVGGLKWDDVLESGAQLAMLNNWYVDEKGTSDYLQVWEDGEMRMLGENEYSRADNGGGTAGGTFTFEYYWVMPVLRNCVVPALDCLWRVLEEAGHSWKGRKGKSWLDFHEKSKLNACWILPDETVSMLHPKHSCLVTRLQIFLCGQDKVEAMEVLDYLPDPGSCPWVHDRVDHYLSAVLEPVGALISKAALACGRCRIQICRCQLMPTLIIS